MTMFTENINKPFTHIPINTALDRIVNGWNTTFYLEKDIEEPFGICFEMFPMSNKHVVSYRLVTMVHRLFEGGHVLRAALLDNLTKYFPVLGNMIITVLQCIIDSPMASRGENDVVFL